MAATSQSEIKIPLADFTSAGGSENAAIFKVELAALALSVQPDRVQINDGNMQLNYDTQAHDPSVDDSLIAQAAIDHVGGATTIVTQDASVGGPLDNDTTSFAVALAFTTAQLVGGRYLATWSAETQLVDLGPGISANGIAVEMNIGVGAAPVQRMLHQTEGGVPGANWQTVASQEIFDVVDGDTVEFSLEWRRTGGAANRAQLRRGRVALVRIPS